MMKVALFVSLLLLCLASPVASYRDVGWPCRATFQCESEYCNSTLQCDAKRQVTEPCPEGVHEACWTGRCSGGVCQEQQPVGGPCVVHEDCLEGWCGDAGACEAWKDREVECAADFECRSGICTRNPLTCTFTVKNDAICGRDEECEGQRCKKDRGLNRCYDRKWNGAFCNDNSDCWSLRCEGTVPDRNCTEPVWLGEPCDEPSDCYSAVCNVEEGKCVATIQEAGSNPELEPPLPGIVGSETVATVSGGGGTVDISNGEVFSGDPATQDSSAMLTIDSSRAGMVMVLLAAAAAAVSAVAVF